jgi:hypothetical protein
MSAAKIWSGRPSRPTRGSSRSKPHLKSQAIGVSRPSRPNLRQRAKREVGQTAVVGRVAPVLQVANLLQLLLFAEHHLSPWADQSVGSLSSALRPNLVNELRFSYWYWHTRNLPPGLSDCPGECIGLGMPEISVLGSDIVAGNFVLTPQGGDTRRYHLSDNLSWH